MMNKEKKQTPVCPSCGEPVRFGFMRFKVSDKVKIFLVLSLIGYFVLSLLIISAVSPAGLNKGCRSYDYIHRPDWCKDTEFTLSVRPLNDNPALQMFVGVGLAMGMLVFYWDWLQNVYENWQRKRGKVIQKHGKMYTCRNCGRQWD